MDAKQLKPYTFWIISGVIIVIQLGLILFWPPTDNGRTPESIKKALDNDFKKLQELHTRAGYRLTGVKDAENEDDIKEMVEKCLITPKWQGALQPVVDKYRFHRDAIRKDLVERSAILHEKILSSVDFYAWYTAYVNQTKDVLIRLRDARALVVGQTDTGNREFEENAEIRSRVGFFTKKGDTPEASIHAMLTAQFRIMQRISQAVSVSAAAALPSPVMKTGREDELAIKAPAHFTGVEWIKKNDPSKTLSEPYAQWAEAHELKLSLEGSTSALMAAQAAIEGISNPVMIVVGGTISARVRPAPGLRKDAIDEPMSLQLSVVVLDFTRMQQLVAAEAATPVVGGTN
jgi:hypothetical protein